MTIDLQRLLKRCQKRISGALNLDPASEKTALVEGLDSPPRDDNGQALSGTSSDRLRVSSRDASVQHPHWDEFFRILLDPQANRATPEVDRSMSAVAGNRDQHMTGPSSADVEDVRYLFPGDAAVETLKAQLDKVPEIRQQRVDWLKQAIAEGRYQMHPQKIAAAMLAEEELNLG